MSLKGADEAAYIKTVVENVWKDGVVDGVEVSDHSGKGGGKTLFVSREGADPPKVVLKIAAEIADDELTVQRMEAGVDALREAGLVEKLLASGVDWEIAPFAGGSVSKIGGPRMSCEFSVQWGDGCEGRSREGVRGPALLLLVLLLLLLLLLLVLLLLLLLLVAQPSKPQLQTTPRLRHTPRSPSSSPRSMRFLRDGTTRSTKRSSLVTRGSR